MNTKFQIQIKISNWEGGSPTITKDITLNDIAKFKELIKSINKYSSKKNWNWFDHLPTKWDGKSYVLDTWMLCRHMKDKFNYDVDDINLVKEFYLRFTPNGAGHIDNIKLFKVEEVEF